MTTAQQRAARHHEAMHDLAAPYEPPTRRSRQRWILLLGLPALLVACAPIITAQTGLRHIVAGAVLAKGQGSLRIGSASLGWFSPVELSNVEWRDADGDRMLLVPKLTLDRSLGQLLIGPTQLGTIRLEQPELNVRLRSDGSNVEDVLAPWLEPTEEAIRWSMALEVRDGKITLHDTPTGHTWYVEPVAVRFAAAPDNPSSTDLPSTVLTLSTKIPRSVATQPSRDGHLAVELNIASQGESYLTIHSQMLPLALFESVTARCLPLAHLGGSLTSQLKISWTSDDASPGFSLRGQTTIDQLEISRTACGEDLLRLARLEFPCQLQLQGDRLRVDQLHIRCDVGELSAQGAFNIGKGTSIDSGTAAANHFQLQGRIDLAPIARMVPGVLNIRPGTTITSGVAELTLRTSREGAEERGEGPVQRGGGPVQRWEGSLVMQGLTGEADGHQVTWDQPIRVELVARQADELAIERLLCESDFFQLQAAGNWRELTATGSFDLKKLVTRLGPFFDLDGWQIAGQGETRLEWSVDDQRRFRAGGSFSLDQFALVGPGRPAWREPSLTIQAAAAGQLADDSYAVERLESASMQLSSADDRVEVRYVPAGPVPTDGGDPSVWPLQLSAEGQLARWQPRLAILLPLDGWTFDGHFNLTAQALYGSDALTVSDAKLQLVNFSARSASHESPSYAITESQVDLIGAGRWDQGQSRIDISSLQLTSSAVGARLENAVVDFSRDSHSQDTKPQDAGPRVTGRLAYQVALDRLQRWFQPTQQNPSHLLAGPSYLLTGKVIGDGQLSSQGAAITARLQSTGHEVTLWRLGEPAPTLRTPNARMADTIVWQDPAPKFDLAATYDRAVRLASAADGHWSERLTAETNFAWERSRLFGLPIGPARLQAKLQDGQVLISPIDLQIGEGRLTAAPRIRLTPGPAVLTLPVGPLVENVHLTPEVTKLALQYIAPVLAGATRIDGRFSIALRGATTPLNSPSLARLEGQLVVHRIEVTPGPLAEEFILLAEQLEAVIKRRRPLATLQRPQRTLLTIADHAVDFRLADGRVHHGDMVFQVGELTLHSRGSVGLDQTLALQLEIPLPEKWTTGGPLRENLRGQSVKIPVHGTLARPQIDGRAVASLSEQLLRGALQGTINSELNNLLDRLLPPPKQ